MAKNKPNIKVIELIPTQGSHPFNKKLPISIFDNTTYKEKKESPNDYINQFSYNFTDAVEANECLRIFLFSEYIKRKFYLDFSKEKKDSKFIKEKNKRYTKKILCGKNLIEIFLKEFNYNAKELTIYNINITQNNLARFFDRHNNLYMAIKVLYKFGFNFFSKLIEEIYKENIQITKDGKSTIINFFNKYPLTPYLFERLLYFTAHPFPFFISGNKDLGKVIKIISTRGEFYPIFSFSSFYSKIVDNYKLYLNDLFRITDLSKMLDNETNDIHLPRFFFIPREPEVDPLIADNIDFDFRSANHSVHIDINLDNIFNICDIAKYIHDNLILGLYQIKEDLFLQYSKREISYISSLIDSDNKHNNTKNFKERLVALYLWDKFYLSDREISLSSTILHYLNRYNRNVRKTKSLTDKFVRQIRATTDCIESGKYLPLA